MPKIYTKTGDQGETSMLGGKRVSKSCLEMEAIGEVDELNAKLGILNAEIKKLRNKEIEERLVEVQNNLFVVGANLAALQTDVVEVSKLAGKEVEKLENWIDELSKDLPELTEFVLPGGCQVAAQSYVARTVCRRAERCLIKLSENYEVPAEIRQYLNRLSDLLFVLARWFNKQQGVEELRWEK